MSYKRNITRYSYKKKINKLKLIKLKKIIKKYRNDPVKFVEDFYGVKLYTYQKILLKMMNKLREGF